jgi:hypothetical protein
MVEEFATRARCATGGAASPASRDPQLPFGKRPIAFQAARQMRAHGIACAPRIAAEDGLKDIVMLILNAQQIATLSA